MTQYSEHELVLPALALLDRYEAGLTTSDLIRELTTILKPDGSDADILAGRNDTYFSQKVRNLVSHRTLAEPGFETYDATRQHHSITPAGRRYLAEARERGELAQVLSQDRHFRPKQCFPTINPRMRRRQLECGSPSRWIRTRLIDLSERMLPRRTR